MVRIRHDKTPPQKHSYFITSVQNSKRNKMKVSKQQQESQREKYSREHPLHKVLYCREISIYIHCGKPFSTGNAFNTTLVHRQHGTKTLLNRHILFETIEMHVPRGRYLNVAGVKADSNIELRVLAAEFICTKETRNFLYDNCLQNSNVNTLVTISQVIAGAVLIVIGVDLIF